MFLIAFYGFMVGWLVSGRTENELVTLGFILVAMLVGIALNIYIEIARIREKLVPDQRSTPIDTDKLTPT